MLETIITKDFINNTIRPFSANDTIFIGALYETLLLDIEPKFDSKYVEDLKAEEQPQYITADLENGLRTAIGYLMLARVYRTGSITATKYGITQKLNTESNPATNAEIVSNANYFREMGFKVLEPIAKRYKDAQNKDTNPASFVRVIGD